MGIAAFSAVWFGIIWRHIFFFTIRIIGCRITVFIALFSWRQIMVLQILTDFIIRKSTPTSHCTIRTARNRVMLLSLHQIDICKFKYARELQRYTCKHKHVATCSSAPIPAERRTNWAAVTEVVGEGTVKQARWWLNIGYCFSLYAYFTSTSKW